MSIPQRKLSPWRVMLALLIVCTIAVSTVGSIRWWGEAKQQSTIVQQSWFAPYVDVTATPTFGFEQVDDQDSNHDAILSFIVSSPSKVCTPTWGGAYTLDEASTALDLDRRIARLNQQGGSVAISFGGLKNDELAVNCADQSKLTRAYRSVIERYNVDTIDLDLEGSGLTDAVAGARRAAAIAQLQSEWRANGKNLAVWVTLPVTPQGLTKDGTNAIAQLLRDGVDLAGVNVMTMNYGESREEGQTMLSAATDALTQTHRQLGVLYQQIDIHLNSATLWSKIGATPMIGQNDLPGEVFTLDDAHGLKDFAHTHQIGRMSMWSANRDMQCGPNYVNIKIVSDACSGVQQKPQEFAAILSTGFTGSMSASAYIVTEAEPQTAQEPDDPATSPYQVWSPTGTYLQGTKVVWHRNVYEAKWWTKGDMPDNPVLQTWETPWRLIGPVLPGEKPRPQPALPAGTYPEWSRTKVYEAGQRVLLKGVPFQAKWWTRGDNPANAAANADTSPWIPLTQEQINQIQAKK